MEKIRKYVERFFAKKPIETKYEMTYENVDSGINEVMRVEDERDAFSVVSTLFEFGYAKGYRAAMAEMKKGGAV